ncbi:putative histone-binding protein rba-1 [Trichinella nativa]|uniref:Histone-binding protein rba-1 n=1 Tax=Trichinella nativa TaxID=6335 RepID=A0A0V1LSG2_9BILA|nr:putative histone-binding protein rba-1 [Trichinella nativa]
MIALNSYISLLFFMKNISPRWFFYIRVLALNLRVSFIRPAVPFTVTMVFVFVFLVTANFDFDSIYSIKVNRSDSAVSSTMPIPAAIRKKLRTESPMISFKIWKHIAPHIYDFCFVANCNACIRSVQCADDVVFLKEDSQECNLIISADSAIGGRLMSATVTIPSVVSPSDSAESSSESRAGYSLTASPNISTDYCLSRPQKVFDSKQMPQKQTLVALQTLDKIELYDTNGFHAVSDMTNTRQADLYFTGLTTKGCGLAWNRLNPGYLLSSDIDGHLCIWDINGKSLDGGKLPPLHSITKGKPSGINEVAWSTKNSLQFGAAVALLQFFMLLIEYFVLRSAGVKRINDKVAVTAQEEPDELLLRPCSHDTDELCKSYSRFAAISNEKLQWNSKWRCLFSDYKYSLENAWQVKEDVVVLSGTCSKGHKTTYNHSVTTAVFDDVIQDESYFSDLNRVIFDDCISNIHNVKLLQLELKIDFCRVVKLFLWSSEPDDRCWLLYVLLKAPLELTSWAPSIVQPIFFDESLDVFQSVEYFLVMLCIVVDATEYVVPAHGESEDNDWEIVKLAEEECKNFYSSADEKLLENHCSATVYNEIYFYLISSDPTLTDFEFFQKRLDSVALIVFGQLFSVNQSLMMSIALTLPIKHLSARCIQALLMFLYADGRSLLEHDENLTAVDIFYQEHLTNIDSELAKDALVKILETHKGEVNNFIEIGMSYGDKQCLIIRDVINRLPDLDTLELREDIWNFIRLVLMEKTSSSNNVKFELASAILMKVNWQNGYNVEHNMAGRVVTLLVELYRTDQSADIEKLCWKVADRLPFDTFDMSDNLVNWSTTTIDNSRVSQAILAIIFALRGLYPLRWNESAKLIIMDGLVLASVFLTGKLNPVEEVYVRLEKESVKLSLVCRIMDWLSDQLGLQESCENLKTRFAQFPWLAFVLIKARQSIAFPNPAEIDEDAEFRAAVKRCFAESVRDARSNLNLGTSLDIVAVKSAVAQDDAWQSVYLDASAPTQLVSLTITDRDHWTATTTAATTVGDLLYDEVLAFVEKNEHLAVERLPEQYSVYFSTLHRAVANLFERYNGFKQSRDDMLKLEKAVVENVRRLYRTTNVQLSTACLDETMRNQLDECWDQMKMHVELFLSQQVSSIITAAGVHLDRLFRNLGNALNSGVSVADEDLFPVVNGIETFCRQKLENFTDTDHYFVNAVFGKLAYNTLFKACLEDHFAVAISYVGVLLDNLEKFTLYKDSLLSWWSFPAISVCEILKLIVKKVTTLTSLPAYDGDDALVEALICILQNLISEEMWSQLTKMHSVVLVEINQSVLEACCLLAGARQMPDHSRSPLLAVFRDWWLRSALLCFPDKLERVLDAVVVVYDPKCSHPLLLDLANNLLTVAKFSNSKAHPLDSAPLIDDIARVLQCWPFSTVISILLDKSEWLKRHGNCTKRLTMITHYSEMAVAILKLLQLGLYNDGLWAPLPSDPPPGKDFCFELFQFFVRFYNLWWTPEDDSLDQHVQEWLIENEHTVGKLCDLFCECFAKTYISVTTNCRQHYVSMYQEMIFDFLLSVILKKNPYYPFVDVTGRFLCSFDWSQWNLDERTISKLAETVSNEMYDSLDISQYTALIVQLPWSTFFETFSTDCTDISKRSAVLAKAIWILISCLKPEHHERCRGSYRTLFIRLFQVSSCSLQFQDFADILSQLSSQQSKTICTYDELDCFDSSVSLLQLLSRFSCCQCMLSTVPSVSCSTKWDVFVRFRLKMIYQLHCDQRCKNSLDYNQLRISWIDLLRDVGAVADAFESVHPELGKFLFMLPMKVLVDVLDLQCESLQDVMEKIVEEWSTTANAYSLQCVIFHLLTEHTFNNPALFAFSEICIKSYFTRPFSDATVVSWKRIMSHLPAECQRQWDIVSCYQRKCYYSLYLIMLYQSKRLHDETLTRFVLDVFASMLASGADEQLCTLYLMLCLHLCTDKFQSTSDNSNPGFDFHIKRLYDIISQVNATDRYTIVQWFWNLFQNSSISPKFGLLCELLKCLLKHLNNIHPFGLCASLANDILPQDVLTQLLRERAGRCYTASVQFTLQAITSEQLNLTNIETIFSNIVLTLYNSHCIVDVAYFTDH